MNYLKIEKCSVSEGQGVRVVLWVSGCRLHCFDCHNPKTHDFNSGVPFTSDTMNELLEALDKTYISGLTLTGGHPLEAENLETVLEIVRTVKEKFPDKTIWLYTGFTWEIIAQVIIHPEYNQECDWILADIIPLVDVIVDGKYEYKLRDITLPFCGSSNQRIIDVQKSLKILDTVNPTVNPHDFSYFARWDDKIVLWQQT